MNFQEFKRSYMNEIAVTLGDLWEDKVLNTQIERAGKLIRAARTIYLVGNGGSAALASHIATDLQLAGVRAISLTDVAAITTYANDQDFAFAFSAQVKRLAQPGDLVIGISGSGNSQNIINALAMAGRVGANTLAIVGKDGGVIKLAQNVLHIPTKTIGPAQDLQQIVLHMICYYLMQKSKEA